MKRGNQKGEEEVMDGIKGENEGEGERRREGKGERTTEGKITEGKGSERTGNEEATLGRKTETERET